MNPFFANIKEKEDYFPNEPLESLSNLDYNGQGEMDNKDFSNDISNYFFIIY